MLSQIPGWLLFFLGILIMLSIGGISLSTYAFRERSGRFFVLFCAVPLSLVYIGLFVFVWGALSKTPFYLTQIIFTLALLGIPGYLAWKGWQEYQPIWKILSFQKTSSRNAQEI